MSSSPEVPSDVPAEDWVEQAADAAVEAEPGQAPRVVDTVDREADEADLVEQQTIAYTGDDEER